VARQMFKDLQKSPYAERIFVVLDSVHGKSLVDSVHGMGIPRHHIVVWDANGVEHVYPRVLLESYFGKFDKLAIVGDTVSANGLEIRKRDLVTYIVDRLSATTAYTGEMISKLLDPIAAVVN
jgi:hypothetical protein